MPGILVSRYVSRFALTSASAAMLVLACCAIQIDEKQ